jgi:hypothetical protein
MSQCEYKFWLWDGKGLIRQKRGESGWCHPEVWFKGQWIVANGSAVDAITGMGPDPWSCGEYAEEMSLDQATEYAASRAIDLFRI